MPHHTISKTQAISNIQTLVDAAKHQLQGIQELIVWREIQGRVNIVEVSCYRMVDLLNLILVNLEVSQKPLPIPGPKDEAKAPSPTGQDRPPSGRQVDGPNE